MFPTPKLDKILGDRRLKLEEKRQKTLSKIIKWLDANADTYNIKKAYIFGSVTKPHKFTESSDVDIAIEEINPESFFFLISLLMEVMERDVDLILLNKCHFAHRIREKGILWKKTI
jgi:predicted nucleotidyltransferase